MTRRKHGLNQTQRFTALFAVLAVLVSGIFYALSRINTEAAVGDNATVTITNAVVKYPKTPTSANAVNKFGLKLYQVNNGVRSPLPLSSGFLLTVSTTATSVNTTTWSRTINSSPFTARKGILYQLEVTNADITGATTGCFVSFRLPARDENAYTFTNSSALSDTTDLIDDVALPCLPSGSPVPSPSQPVVLDPTLPEICNRTKLDVLFVVDASGTMNDGSNPVINTARQFVRQTKWHYQSGDRAGLVRYHYASGGTNTGSYHPDARLTEIDFPIQETTHPVAIQNITGRMDAGADGSNPGPGVRTALDAFNNKFGDGGKRVDATAIIIFIAEDQTNLDAGQFNIMKNLVDEAYKGGLFFYSVPVGGGFGSNQIDERMADLAKMGGGITTSPVTNDTLIQTEAEKVFKHINSQFDNCVKITTTLEKNFGRDGIISEVYYDIRNLSRKAFLGTVTQALPQGLVSTATGSTTITIPQLPLTRGEQRRHIETVRIQKAN